MSSSSFVDYFDTNISLLKWGGIWMPEKGADRRTKFWYALYNGFWITYSMVVYTPCEFIILRTSARDFNDLIKNLNMSMTHLLGIVKVLIWFANRDRIIDIIQTLKDAAATYEPIAGLRPDEIIAADKVEIVVCTRAFLSVACCVSISSLVNALVWLATAARADVDVAFDAANATVVDYAGKLPYFSYVPWDYGRSTGRYLTALLYQFFPTFNMAFVIVGFDALFTTIVSYTSSQLLVLQGAFRTIKARCERRLTSGDADDARLSREMMEELRNCMRHLQTIFNICEKVESIFTYVTLVQVLISLLVFCTCLYLVSSYPFSNFNFMVELIYLVAIQMQLASYCYFGNKITLRGEDISLALYESDWLAASLPFKRSMLITMTRVRRPIHLTMGKFSPLTLATYVTISRASYSCFAVLKNRQ